MVVVFFFLSLGVMLTNAYVMKCKIDLEEGVEKKDLMSQYKFRKLVAIAWINPEEFKRDYGVEISGMKRKRKTEERESASAISSLSHGSNVTPTYVPTTRRCIQVTDNSLI